LERNVKWDVHSCFFDIRRIFVVVLSRSLSLRSNISPTLSNLRHKLPAPSTPALPEASTFLKLSATTEQLALDSAALLLTELMLLEKRAGSCGGLPRRAWCPWRPRSSRRPRRRSPETTARSGKPAALLRVLKELVTMGLHRLAGLTCVMGLAPVGSVGRVRHHGGPGRKHWRRRRRRRAVIVRNPKTTKASKKNLLTRIESEFCSFSL
jgi:hypothetical protein